MSDKIKKAVFSPVSDEVLEGESSRYFTFFNVILTLVVLTFLELILIGFPFHPYLLLASLGVLSVIKFVLVIWFFMHLRWDQKLLTALFVLGMVLATGTVIVLYLLFPPEENTTDAVESPIGVVRSSL